MSGESLPSICYAVPCFELFMTAWEKLAKENPVWNHSLQWASNGPQNTTSVWTIHALTLSLCVSSLQLSRECADFQLRIVVDPCRRMSWIDDQWDKDWANSAKTTVLKLVGLHNSHSVRY
jgi:hypothetical protein